MVCCWKPILDEADARRIGERLGRVEGDVEAVFYPVWCLAIEVGGRLPFLRGFKSVISGMADGVSGRIWLVSGPVEECDVDADPASLVEIRITVEDDETRRSLEERLVPVVLARLKTPLIAPSVRIVGTKQMYRKIFRMRIAGRGGEIVLYVDSATREHACLPAGAVNGGGTASGQAVVGGVDVAGDSRAS